MLILNVECKDRINGVINFVNGALRPVKSDIDTELSSWYRENSRVYVASDHACWSDVDLTRKVHKRRFGSVIKSPANGLNRMMAISAKEVQQWMEERAGEESGAGETTEEEVAEAIKN